jgi:hypothetical protein
MKRTFGVVVAVRELREVGENGKVVVVKLGEPREAKSGDWACPFRITGLGIRGSQFAYGIDAFQSLLLAIEGIRSALQKSGKRFTWAGGEPGDTGFPRFVPNYFGLEFSTRLEELIEREVELHAGKMASNR